MRRSSFAALLLRWVAGILIGMVSWVGVHAQATDVAEGAMSAETAVVRNSAGEPEIQLKASPMLPAARPRLLSRQVKHPPRKPRKPCVSCSA